MEILTACTLDCPDACSLLVKILAHGAIRIRGNPNHPVTKGFTCAKIRRFGQRLSSKHRITRPLLRQGQDWKPIDWEEALQLCAEKIQEHRSEPESILHLRGEGDKGVLSQASKLFFAELGASTTAGSLCDVAGIAACIADFGSLETNDDRYLYLPDAFARIHHTCSNTVAPDNPSKNIDKYGLNIGIF